MVMLAFSLLPSLFGEKETEIVTERKEVLELLLLLK